jgi:hypothetical protein
MPIRDMRKSTIRIALGDLLDVLGRSERMDFANSPRLAMAIIRESLTLKVLRERLRARS